MSGFKVLVCGRIAVCAVICAWFGGAAARAQEDVTVQVKVASASGSGRANHGGANGDASNVVVWLTPTEESKAAEKSVQNEVPQLVQQNKTFEPHVVVVQTGSVVAFPNHDPFLHNVFSLFDGKRFDLGFYEAGTSCSVRFDRAGVSYLFCNIHPEMSAVVVAVDTPYYSISGRNGEVTIHNVPDGHYRLQVWYERSPEEDLRAQTRMVTIAAGARRLAPIYLTENPNFTPAHKNKYGQDYAPHATTTPY